MKETLIRLFVCSLVKTITLARYIPIKALYLISSFASRLLALTASSHTKRVKRNLEIAFDGMNKKTEQSIVHHYYRNLYDFTFELAKNSYHSDYKICEECRFTNIEFIKTLLLQNKKILCYSGHFVNYELLVSFPLHIQHICMGNLYYSGKRNLLTDWLAKTRQRYGAINIPHNSPIKPILAMLKELEKKRYDGIVLGSLADVPPSKRSQQYIHKSPFFDHLLSVYTGTEKIGRKYNMIFVYAHISRNRRGIYNIEFKQMSPKDINTNPYAYTDEFVRLLEQNIREQPDLWMLWGNKRLSITSDRRNSSV